MTSFTNTNFHNALPGDVIRDKVVPGLMFRKGKRRSSFYINYRDAGGKERRPVIGTFPVLDVRKAREVAIAKLQKVQVGTVLSGSKTVADAWEIYLEVDAKEYKYNTIKAYRSIYKRYIEPSLGRRPFHKITYDELQELHSSVKGNVMPNRVIKLIGNLYKVARRKGWYNGDSLTKLVILNKERARRRYMTRDEFVRFGDTIQRWQMSNASSRQDFATLLLLLLYTACRKTELLDLRWEHIDWVGDFIVLPDTKTEVDKHIPLSTKARTILIDHQGAHAVNGEVPRSGKVFPVMGDHQRYWLCFKQDAGLSDLTIHDLRRSAATAGFSNGMAKDEVGQVLGHTNSSTTDGYAYLMVDKKRKLAEKMSNSIDQLISSDV